jgi:acetyl esterase/lipase
MNEQGIALTPFYASSSIPASGQVCPSWAPWFRLLLACGTAVLVTGCVFIGPPRAVTQPKGVDIERNITFASVDGHDLKLDLYVPHGAQSSLPVVVWIHGGGWFRGSRNPCPIAPLATQGYVVAAVEYRLSGTA